MKSIKKVPIQNIQINSSANSVVKYDSEFIILLPHTIVTKDILEIFQQTYLENIVSEEPLNLKDTINPKNVSNKNQSTSTDISDVDDDTEALRDSVEAFKHFENMDPYLIAQTYKEYNTLYEYAYSLLMKFHTTDTLMYKEIQEFVCNELMPRVKKNPYPYLAIGNMLLDSKEHTTNEIAFKYLLLTLAILEQSESKELFFHSIDKRIEMAICAFVSYIATINLEKQIKQTIDFTNPKAREVLIKISAKTLQKRHFPSYIVDVVKHMKSYKPQAQSIQYENVDNEINIVANLLTIIDYYIQSIILKHQTPFQTLKIMIDDRYNFNAKNIKLFTKSIGIIPIGSNVRLRNQSYGIISHFPKETPLMPEVHLVTDQKGNSRKSFMSVRTEEHEYNIIEIPSYETGVKMIKTYLHMLKSKYQ